MGILTDIGQSVQRRGNGRKGDNWCPLWRGQIIATARDS
jgi:hypothetical protein